MRCPKCKENLPKELLAKPQVIIQRNTHKRKLARLKNQFNKNVNIFIGNKLNDYVKKVFLGKEKDLDWSVTLHYRNDPWLSGVMRDIGLFDSISEAKAAGWHKKADMGFSCEIVSAKKRPHSICIFKESIVKA